MQTLEVRHLGRVPGLHQRFEPGLDERRGAAAEHRLLAKQIGFGFLAERCLDDASAAGANGGGIGQRNVLGEARRVLGNRNEARHTATLRVSRTHRVTRTFRRDHHDIQIGARFDEFEMNVQPVPEREHCALPDVRLDLLTVDRGMLLIRREQHHEVRLRHRAGDVRDSETRALRLLPRLGAFAQANHDIHAGIPQVVRVRVTLRTVANYRHRAVLNQGQIGVFVVIDLHGNLEQ